MIDSLLPRPSFFSIAMAEREGGASADRSNLGNKKRPKGGGIHKTLRFEAPKQSPRENIIFASELLPLLYFHHKHESFVPKKKNKNKNIYIY